MQIKWYGHSCFLLTADNGTRILTDPCDDIGYPRLELEADIVTISHEHHDHNDLTMVKGAPDVIRTAGGHEYRGIKITGIKSFHDDAQGALRGENIIYLIETDGLRLAHTGDLGCLPSDGALGVLNPVDILFIPCGGEYTIGPRLACETANAVHARVLIPMHYQTPALKLNKRIYPVDELLSIAKNCKIHKLNDSECTITKSNLSEDRLIVFDYARQV